MPICAGHVGIIAYIDGGRLAHDSSISLQYDRGKWIKEAIFIQELIARSQIKRIFLPFLAGLAGVFFLTGVYFGIVSWAETPQHATELFWQDRWIVIPILIGFGVQTALYVILNLRLYFPQSTTGHTGQLMGAGGATSTVAMVACCAHHVTDVLPILGLTAAAAFLAQYRQVFMLAGLGLNLIGIVAMLLILRRERLKALQAFLISPMPEST